MDLEKRIEREKQKEKNTSAVGEPGGARENEGVKGDWVDRMRAGLRWSKGGGGPGKARGGGKGKETAWGEFGDE